MKKTIIFVVFCFVLIINLLSQKIVLPLLGDITNNSAKILVHYRNEFKSMSLIYNLEGDDSNINLNASYNSLFPVLFHLKNLKNNSTYRYKIKIETEIGVHITENYFFKTDNSASNSNDSVSFVFGSCAFLHDTVLNEPVSRVSYVGGTNIFNSISKEDVDFMLWLGDNWYYRDKINFLDFLLNKSEIEDVEQMKKRVITDRFSGLYDDLFAKFPHYAIWDDHDFAGNDSDSSFELKHYSRTIFSNFWGNPSFGQNERGIYTSFSKKDVDFILLDDRFFKNSNSEWGEEQKIWLKEKLISSKGKIKFIANGIEILNEKSKFETTRKFKKDFNYLIDLIKQHKIEGVVFLSGDRHFSQIITEKFEGMYQLYDITCSALTSKGFPLDEMEQNYSKRIFSINQTQNYCRADIFKNSKEETIIYIQIKDFNGTVIKDYSINASALRF